MNCNIKIAKNTLILYFRMILILIVSLYTSRLILNILGVQDFGIYNVVGGVVTIFGFLNGAMASSTQRFLSFELGRGDIVKLKRIFNVSLIIHISIAILVLILAETFGFWFLNNYLNLPENRIEAAQFIFHFSVLSIVISIIQLPYNAIIIAREHMNIYAYISIIEVLFKLSVVFILPTISYDKLKFYGFLLFIINFIIALTYIIYVNKNFKETSFQFTSDKYLYKVLISYSGWNIFGALSMIIKGQGITILLNIFFGTIVNASHAIAMQISGAINSFVSNFQIATNPQIVKSFATNDKVYMTSLVIKSARYSFYLIFILTFPIIIEIKYILKVWLNIIPAYTEIFTILILINAWIESISGPLVTMVNATGKIKYYQVIIGLVFMLNLPISFFLFKIGYSSTSTFILNIVITFLVLLLRLFFANKLIKEFTCRRFIFEVIFKGILILLLSIIFPYLIYFNYSQGFFRFIIVIIFSITSTIVLVYNIGMTENEKKMIKSYLYKYLNKIKNAN